MAFSFSCFPSVGSFVLPRSGFGPSMLECMLKNMFESFNTLVCVCKKKESEKACDVIIEQKSISITKLMLKFSSRS